MSFTEDATALERSFRNTHELLRQLLQGLQGRRAAWVSARPSTLAPSPELERLTQEIAREESLRDELIARIRRSLPAPLGAEHASLHVNVTRIAAALPPLAARSLRDAADHAQALAKAVRTEVTLGQRLVRFARDAHGSTAIGGGAARGSVPGYDRRAQLVRGNKTAGALVDGRV